MNHGHRSQFPSQKKRTGRVQRFSDWSGKSRFILSRWVGIILIKDNFGEIIMVPGAIKETQKWRIIIGSKNHIFLSKSGYKSSLPTENLRNKSFLQHAVREILSLNGLFLLNFKHDKAKLWGFMNFRVEMVEVTREFMSLSDQNIVKTSLRCLTDCPTEFDLILTLHKSRVMESIVFLGYFRSLKWFR